MDKPRTGKTTFMITVSGNYIFNMRKREGGEEEKKSKQRRGSKYVVHCGWRCSLQTDFGRQQRPGRAQRPQTLASARVSSQGKGRCAPSEYSGKECCGGSPTFILLNADYNVCLLGSRKTQTAQINRPPDTMHQMRPNRQDSPEQCHQWTQPLMFWCEYGENQRVGSPVSCPRVAEFTPWDEERMLERWAGFTQESEALDWALTPCHQNIRIVSRQMQDYVELFIHQES